VRDGARLILGVAARKNCGSAVLCCAVVLFCAMP
jgi:hypothetical protein